MELPAETIIASPPRANRRMSFDEFMTAYDGRFAEWVGGEVIEFMTASDAHQGILNFLAGLITLYVKLLNMGVVRTAPYAMRATPGGPVREPDLLYLANENASRRTKRFLQGPADLIVEIVSNESVRRDRDDKYHEYAHAGVREYWVIDSRDDRRRADFFRLLPVGRYELFATEDDERVESSVVAGFWLRPAWLWEVEERDPLATLMEIRGLSAEAAEQIKALLRGDQH
jgi:Uma2 family endonuclease